MNLWYNYRFLERCLYLIESSLLHIAFDCNIKLLGCFEPYAFYYAQAINPFNWMKKS